MCAKLGFMNLFCHKQLRERGSSIAVEAVTVFGKDV